MDKKPIIAIMYDFDKTLITNNMQNFGFIPSLGISEGEFWGAVDEFTRENEMDGLLSYMYFMLKYANSRDIKITREEFVKLGKGIEFFPGVEEWFERIRAFGAEHGVIVEHYIISSGLKEMIEGTPIAKAGAFEKIYASSFMFDKKGVIVIEDDGEIDEDELMMNALDAGADDFTAEDGFFEILTDPDSFSAVYEALADGKDFNFVTAEVRMVPQTMVELTDEEDLKKMNKLIEMLDDNDDVQNVYHNWDE